MYPTPLGDLPGAPQVTGDVGQHHVMQLVNADELARSAGVNREIAATVPQLQGFCVCAAQCGAVVQVATSNSWGDSSTFAFQSRYSSVCTGTPAT